MKRIICTLLAVLLLSSALFATGNRQSAGQVINGLQPVTLSFIFFDSKKSATDEVWNAMADRFRNQLNANFDVSFIAGSDYKDRMLVKFAAGDVWDLNFDGDWLQYYQAAAMNGYMALDDLLPRYAPDLNRTLQQSGALEAAKVNGRIVAIPWTIVMSNRPFFQWRGDLIDVNPSTVNTIEDVERVLYELKRRYPDRYTIENAGMDFFLLKNDMFSGPRNFVFNINDPRYQMSHIAETPAYLERAQYAEKWQRDGLIWADVLVDQLDHNQLINQGRLVTKWGTHEFANDSRAWVEPAARWASNSLYNDKKYPLRTPLGNIVAIPRTARNPERTLMWLNLVETSQEMFDLLMYGIEGRTYVKDTSKPNTVMYPAGMNDNNSNFMNWQGRWALFKPQFMRGDPLYAEGFWASEREFAQGNPNNIASPLDGFSFNAEPVVTELAQIDAIYDAANRMLDVGLAGPSATVIQTLIADMNRAGLPRVKAEYQRQVDAFIASKR
jgi:putative aldouronate transport system substrate-binding protein